jgi:hypothetical protein
VFTLLEVAVVLEVLAAIFLAVMEVRVALALRQQLPVLA